MKTLLNIVFIFYIVTIVLTGQYQKSTIDIVYSYTWGYGQNQGQAAEYFPANIFGIPDSNARYNLPSSDPYEICSIGMDGEIVVGFNDFIIVDGPGPDFIIFENAFINPVTNKVFAEPAQVSVSYDGIIFYPFPFDSHTLIGCAGITPTNGQNDCFNPEISGGDKFDFADIGIPKAKFIKIKDITNMVLSNHQHPFFDPILSGFDLDAVVGLNLIEERPLNIEQIDDKLKIKSNMNHISVINANKHSRLLVTDVLGRIIKDIDFSFNTEVFIDTCGFVIVLIMENSVIKKKIKLML